jgi:hypothetical protein
MFFAQNQHCTATAPSTNQVCTWTAKTRAIPSLHRDKLPAPPEAGYQDSARMLRRVTQPPHIAGPLANIALNTRTLGLPVQLINKLS